MKNCITGTFDTPQAIVLRGGIDMNNERIIYCICADGSEYDLVVSAYSGDIVKAVFDILPLSLADSAQIRQPRRATLADEFISVSPCNMRVTMDSYAGMVTYFLSGA